MQGNNKKIIAVLPAYNAARTLKQTLMAIPRPLVDEVILVDDKSRDNTVEVACSLGIRTFVHKRNRGYGGNQKTCYREALALGADIVVMVHPDFQYDPAFIPEMIMPIANGEAGAVFGSRMIIPGNALVGGMPRWKWLANIFLTKLENLILGLNLTEYHSGFRAYSRKALELPIELNSDAFVFDTEIIVQLKLAGYKISEIPITTRYFPEASMIGFWKSVRYGFSILLVMTKYLAHVLGIRQRQFIFNNLDRIIACPICGKSKSQLRFSATDSIDVLFNKYFVTDAGAGRHLEIRQCLNCQVSFVPQTGELLEKLNDYYKNAPLDESYLSDEKGRRATARNLLKNLAPSRLLDFGSNVGIFLDEARKLGFEVYGVESSEKARKYAKDKFSLSLVPNTPDQKFDLITLFDVLEHVSDPKGLLVALSAHLSSDGKIIITSPDLDALAARLWGKHWFALIPGHLFFFPSRTTEYLAETLGLKLERLGWYRRYLSLNYLLGRILRISPFSFPIVGKINIPINTFDQPVWVLKKS